MHGLYVGLGPFVIYIVCRMVHYVTGSLGPESEFFEAVKK